VIRVGWLPSLSRPVSRRRTLAYSRRRSRVKSARGKDAEAPVVVNDGDMIFDQPPGELPVATIVPRSRKMQLRADLFAWLSTKWRWFKPRTIPMIVAFCGMLAVIGAANYLRNFARQAPERLAVKPVTYQWSLQVTTVAAPAAKPLPVIEVPVEPQCCGGRPCD